MQKQLVKAPKLHFFDSGLHCHLPGVRTAEELRHHPLRGAVFESWVASERYKRHVHRGDQPELKRFASREAVRSTSWSLRARN